MPDGLEDLRARGTRQAPGRAAMGARATSSLLSWNASTCVHAAGGGHLATLRRARDLDERTCTNAARGGHLEVLRWAPAGARLPICD